MFRNPCGDLTNWKRSSMQSGEHDPITSSIAIDLEAGTRMRFNILFVLLAN